MKKLTVSLLAGLFTFCFLASLPAQTPYRDDGTVLKLKTTSVEDTVNKAKAVISSAENSIQQGASSFDANVAKGLDSISKSLDSLAKSLDGITGDLNSAAASAAETTSGIAAGETGTCLPRSNGGQSAGTQLGQTIKDFFSAIVNLAKSFGAWVKAAWEEMTGPSKEEAPIANAVNDIKTDWEKTKMQRSAKIVNQSAGKMFSAFGTFFKSLTN